jgi:hypothetical protein
MTVCHPLEPFGLGFSNDGNGGILSHLLVRARMSQMRRFADVPLGARVLLVCADSGRSRNAFQPVIPLTVADLRARLLPGGIGLHRRRLDDRER